MKNIVFVSVFFAFLSLFAAENKDDFSIVTKVPDGIFNFTFSELVITGNGVSGMNPVNFNSAKINAEKSALSNALEKTVNVLYSLVLTGKITAKNYFEDKKQPDFIKKLVSADDFKEIIQERYYSNASVDVTYKVDVSGYLRKIAEAVKSDYIHDEEVPEGNEVCGCKNETCKTALVIDAKNIKIEPSLLVSLIDEAGEKIYDISMSSVDEKTFTLPFWVKKKADFLIKEGSFPAEFLYIKAFKKGKNSEIVIKSEDTAKIRNELSESVFQSGTIAVIVN